MANVIAPRATIVFDRPMLRQLYLSPLGSVISMVLRAIAAFKKPFMVYGYKDRVSGRFRKFTRISSSAIIDDRQTVAIEDHVWIWHHTIIDGSNGVTIGKGAQIGAWVGIFSHGSERAVRLYGESYITVDRDDRKGYTRGSVVIGEYSFIGAQAIILPGVTIGKGALVAAGAVVSSNVPDYGIARGSPAKVVGDTRKLDEKFWDDPEIQRTYYDSPGMKDWLQTRH